MQTKINHTLHIKCRCNNFTNGYLSTLTFSKQTLKKNDNGGVQPDIVVKANKTVKPQVKVGKYVLVQKARKTSPEMLFKENVLNGEEEVDNYRG